MATINRSHSPPNVAGVSERVSDMQNSSPVSLTVKLDLLLLGLHEDDDVASEVHHGAAPMMEIEGVFGSPLTANQITLSDWRDSPHNVRSQYVL